MAAAAETPAERLQAGNDIVGEGDLRVAGAAEPMRETRAVEHLPRIEAGSTSCRAT